MMQINKNLDDLAFAEILQEYGLADFTYIEISSYLEQLEEYRQRLHEKIKEKQNDTSQGLGGSKGNVPNKS